MVRKLLAEKLVADLQLQVGLQRLVVDLVLKLTLGSLEASTHLGRLRVVVAAGQLGRQLGLFQEKRRIQIGEKTKRRRDDKACLVFHIL